MRTFCFLLILVNALFLSWSQLIDVRIGDLDRNPAAHVTPPPRIVLAQEASTAEPAVIRPVQPPQVAPLGAASSESTATSTTLAAAQVATVGGLACTSVGPFPELADAAHAQAALKSAGFEARQRMEQGELWVGYWVSIQNFESRAAAEATLKALVEGGVTDVYLMPGAEPASVLSLGVFSDHQRALRRAEEIRALGLEPRIDDRKRAGSVYWLDVDLSQPGQVIDTSIFQTDPGKITRLELRACPAPSGNG